MTLPDGQYGAICYYFDSTRLREAEEKLRKNEERFRSYFELGLIGMAITSPTKGIIDVNKKFCEILGYDRSEVLTLTWAELTHADDLAADVANFNRMLAGEIDGYSMDKRFIRKNGDVIDATISVKCIRTADGSVDYCVALLHDITDRKRAEVALKESEAQFCSVLDNSQDVIYRLNVQTGCFEYISPSAGTVVGYSPDELRAQNSETSLAMIHPDDLPAMRAALARLEETGQAKVEYRQRAKSGDYRWISNYMALTRDGTGQPLYRDGNIRDITEHKQAEEAQSALLRKLQQTNEEAIRQRILLETVVRQMPVGLVVLDREGQAIVRNAKAEEISHEPTYRDFFQRYHGTSKYRREDGTFYQVEDLPTVRALRKGETIVAASMIFDDPDGREVHLSVNSAPLLDPEGRIIGSVSIYWDITDRKRTEEMLRESERLLRDVIDGSTSPIFLKDVDGKFFTINASLERMLRISREDIKGKTDYDIASKEVSDYWRAHDKKVMETGKAIQIEEVAELKDGHHIFLANKFPLVDAVGQVYGVGAISHDITDRKRVEMALKEQAQQLEEVNKELESFSYSVSHDLRAPLRAITGYSQMILKKEGARFDEETQRRFQMIMHNTETMGRLIDDLLAFSRLVKQSVAKTSLNMEGLIGEVWQEVLAINPDREMTLKIEQVPAAWGDRTLIQQVYSNLLENAVKFTQVRNPAVIEAGSLIKDGDTVYYVRDNGIGFDMKFYDKLFGVFQRLHSDEDYKGTGIGLALVQRIINRHGGRVWAEGEVDKGATFYFTLPTPQE